METELVILATDPRAEVFAIAASKKKHSKKRTVNLSNSGPPRKA